MAETKGEMMPDNSKKKILLVDDDIVSLTVAEAMLTDTYDVTTAKSGKDALFLMLHDYKPDLILLDLIMPEMDGWEAYHKIKGIGILNSIPIAFLTSVTDEDKIKLSQQIGAADYITKPYDRGNILNRIEIILNSKNVA